MTSTPAKILAVSEMPGRRSCSSFGLHCDNTTANNGVKTGHNQTPGRAWHPSARKSFNKSQGCNPQQAVDTDNHKTGVCARKGNVRQVVQVQEDVVLPGACEKERAHTLARVSDNQRGWAEEHEGSTTQQTARHSEAAHSASKWAHGTREPNGEQTDDSGIPTPRPSLISMVMARETTSREARSLALGACLCTTEQK